MLTDYNILLLFSMKKSRLLVAFILLSSFHGLYAQLVVSNGALITINSGALVHSNGGVDLTNATNLVNNGTLVVTKNSSLTNAGTFSLLSASQVAGNGVYSIEQNWVNNAQFNADLSEVRLYGNTEQLITSTNGTITEFHRLVLTGTGVGVDRRKSLLNVGARISLNGQLNLNNRELYGNTNNLVVLNPSSTAIVNATSFGNEGFISHLMPATIQWSTNSGNNYIFPVGSSDGVLRYRPISLKPSSTLSSIYSVRMNNYSADLDAYYESLKEPSIESVNTAFYHSIDRLAGETNASLAIAYNPATDGDFTGIAHWSVMGGLWQDIANTAESPFGGYKSFSKSNWTFNNDGDPYILTNTSEFIEVPNVFTPNGDGTNDFYFINSKGMIELSITIVNRWGEVVYKSNDIEGKWDGTSKGNLCADGVYFYILNAKSKTQEYQKEGHITLNAN